MGKELKTLNNSILSLRDLFIKNKDNGFYSISKFIQNSSFIEEDIHYSFIKHSFVLLKFQFQKLFSKIKHNFSQNKLSFYKIEDNCSLLCEQINKNQSKIIFFIININNISYYISEDELYYFDKNNNFNIWEFDSNQIIKNTRRQKTIYDIPLFYRNKKYSFTTYYLNKKIVINKEHVNSGDVSANVYNYNNQKKGVYLTVSEDPYSHNIEYFKNFEILNNFVEIIINDSNNFQVLNNIRQKVIEGCFQKPSIFLNLESLDENIKIIKMNNAI